MDDRDFFDERRRLAVDPRYSIDLYGNVYGAYGRILKPSTATGYAVVNIGRKPFYVHRLMAETFIPNPDGKPHVAHWDNNGLNNAINNLRWATVPENMSDKRRHGTSRNHAKLDERAVVEIRRRKGEYRGVQRDLSILFDVSESTISEIMNGWHWKEVS